MNKRKRKKRDKKRLKVLTQGLSKLDIGQAYLNFMYGDHIKKIALEIDERISESFKNNENSSAAIMARNAVYYTGPRPRILKATTN